MFRKIFFLFLFAFLVSMGAAHFSPAEAKFSKAKQHGKALCAKGSFFDPRNGGECWSCPKGTHRTIFGVTGNKACERRAYERFKKAKKKRKNKRIGQGCPRGQFWDVKGGKGLLGACYQCAKGYRRTAYAVNHKRSCAKKIKAQRKKASYKRKFGCPKGQFFDPRKGGQCWSCPKSWHRTVNPVTHAKACTNKPVDIFAADTSEVCKGFINALNTGVEETKKFVDSLKKFTDPVEKTMDDAMKKLTAQVKSPKELDKLLNKMAKAMKPYKPVMAEIQRYQEGVKAKKKKLRGILLNADLMCDGDDKKILAALKSAGFKPPRISLKKASLFDDFLVRPAHAAGKDWFVGFSVAAIMVNPGVWPPGLAFTFTLVTDFSRVGYILSIGTTWSTEPGLGLNFGTMVFPEASISDFTGFQTLGMSFSFSQGKVLKSLVKKWGTKGIFVPAGFTVSFDRRFHSFPGIGIDWTLVDVLPKKKQGKGGKLFNLSFTTDYSWAFK